MTQQITHIDTPQKIAELLGMDGQRWSAKDGRNFSELVDEHLHTVDYRDGHGTDVVRYTFRDGSVLTVAGAAWGFGHADCYCWDGIDHSDECVR